jgi:hypothetical protein
MRKLVRRYPTPGNNRPLLYDEEEKRIRRGRRRRTAALGRWRWRSSEENEATTASVRLKGTSGGSQLPTRQSNTLPLAVVCLVTAFRLESTYGSKGHVGLTGVFGPKRAFLRHSFPPDPSSIKDRHEEEKARRTSTSRSARAIFL